MPFFLCAAGLGAVDAGAAADRAQEGAGELVASTRRTAGRQSAVIEAISARAESGHVMLLLLL